MNGTNKTNEPHGSPMDGLVTLARVGTGRHNSASEPLTHTPIDDLAATLPAEEPERALLLRAGALAIYRQAGQTAQESVELPTPAAPETRPVCSPGAATLLGRMLKEGSPLLAEALERLNRAGQRLPFDLLPDAFNGRHDEHRKLLAPVLGERGRWLSHFVDSWDWVDATQIELAGMLPANADDIWQEGKLEERLALLRQARLFTPERARAWVEAVWKQEKVNTREQLIASYEINLSLDDEPFLEAAMDDRGQNVRATAIRLLTRLPGSAFAERAIERADGMLDYREGKLIAIPPKEPQTAWARDGLTVNADKTIHKNKGARALLLTEALAQINPTHWQQRFGLTPDELLRATGGDDWQEAILEGWCRAAQIHRPIEWMLPFWRFLNETTDKQLHVISDHYSWALFQHGPAEERRRIALELLANTPLYFDDSTQSNRWEAAIRNAPTPWDDEFSRVYLDGLRAFAESLKVGLYQSKKMVAPWNETLEGAQTALAISRIADAATPFEMESPTEKRQDWRVTATQIQLKDFTDTMRQRQRLLEEIPE